MLYRDKLIQPKDILFPDVSLKVRSKSNNLDTYFFWGKKPPEQYIEYITLYTFVFQNNRSSTLKDWYKGSQASLK